MKALLVLLTLTLMTGQAVLAKHLYVDAGIAETQNENGSPEQPFTRIGQALNEATDGDHIDLASGVYVETLQLSDLNNISIEGTAPVVITQAIPVTNWTTHSSGLFTATFNKKPLQVWREGRRIPCSRFPTESWFPVEDVKRNESASTWSLAAPGKITDELSQLAGARIHIWTRAGNQFFHCPIQPGGLPNGRLQIQYAKTNMEPADGDLFAIENAVALLPQTGGWATRQNEPGQWTLYLQGSSENISVVTSTATAISGKNTGNISLSGLTLSGIGGDGIRISQAEQIQVNNCQIMDCEGIGLVFEHIKGGRISNSYVHRNRHGVNITKGSKALTVEDNDIGYNGTDGLLISFGCSDILVKRNFLHHHQNWGHPDNAQMYRNVRNIRFIENIFLSGGQALMTQESEDITFSGNLLVGSAANQLILGHNSSHRFIIDHNTFAFAGYSGLNITGQGHLIRSNIFVNAHGHAVYGSDAADNFKSDYNLLWNTAPPGTAPLLSIKGHWPKDLATAQKLGIERHSKFANPNFVHAPQRFNVISREQLLDCTRERVYLRETNEFEVGETIEFNFDGQARRVTKTDGACIQFEPALEQRPLKCWMIAGWGAETDVTLDLTSRTAPDLGAPASVIERLRLR